MQPNEHPHGHAHHGHEMGPTAQATHEGETYTHYAANTPAFFPRVGQVSRQET